MANKKEVKEKKKKEEKSEEISKKEDNKRQDRILRNVLIVTGMIFLLIAAIVIIGKSATKFTYEGVKFEMIKEGDLIFYATSLPVDSELKVVEDKNYEGQIRDYNLYLRNDPRKLEIPFEGDLYLKKNTVLNLEKDFKCEGKGIIGLQNLLILYRLLEINIVSDENATCDDKTRYTFIQILEGNETKIEQTGESCYEVYINNCEILEATEKLMIETLIKVNAAI